MAQPDDPHRRSQGALLPHDHMSCSGEREDGASSVSGLGLLPWQYLPSPALRPLGRTDLPAHSAIADPQSAAVHRRSPPILPPFTASPFTRHLKNWAGNRMKTVLASASILRSVQRRSCNAAQWGQRVRCRSRDPRGLERSVWTRRLGRRRLGSLNLESRKRPSKTVRRRSAGARETECGARSLAASW